MAELCSTYIDPEASFITKVNSPFDNITERTIQKNGYIGLGACFKKEKGYKEQSGHVPMLQNKQLLDFLAETLIAEKPGTPMN